MKLESVSNNTVSPSVSRREKKTQSALVVLGMHRSGTSMISRALAVLGEDLPKTLLGANAGNPMGHFESAPLISVNDDILANLHSAWHDAAPLCLPAPRSLTARRLYAKIRETLTTEYLGVRRPLVKDPRICRLVPLYAGAFASLGVKPHYLLPYRHPIEVAGSLQQRDGFEAAYGALLWLRYVVEAERHTRLDARAFVRQDDLLTDSLGALTQVYRQLGLSPPRSFDQAAEEINAGIAPELKHQHADIDTVIENEAFSEVLSSVHQAMGVLSQDPYCEQAMSKMDEAARWLQTAHQDILSIHALEARRRQIWFEDAAFKLAKTQADLSARETSWKVESERLGATLAIRDREILEAISARAQAAAQAAAAQERSSVLQQTVQLAEQAAAGALREATNARELAHAHALMLRTHEAELERLRAQESQALARLQAELDQAQNDLGQSRVETQSVIAALQHDLDVARQGVGELERARESLREQLAGAQSELEVLRALPEQVAALQAKSAQVEDLRVSMEAYARENQSLREALAAAQAERDHMVRAASADAVQAVGAYSERLSAEAARSQELQAQLLAARLENENLRASLSWQVGAPLRFFDRSFRPLANLMRRFLGRRTI